MRSTRLIALFITLCAASDRMIHQRRGHALGQQRRQLVGLGNGAASSAAGTTTSDSGNNGNGNAAGGGNQAQQTSTTATGQNNGGGGIASVIGSIVEPDRVTSTAPVPTITVSASASRSTAPSTRASSTGPTVINLTLTSTASGLASSSAAAATSAAASNSGNGGLGKGTIIAVGVVAGSVALVAAIWTIFRKWKLGPSRRFEDKLQPVELFDPKGPDARRLGAGFEARNAPAYGSQVGLTRADSNGSGSLDGGLKRAGSFGSNHGSQVGSQRGHHPAMSEVCVPSWRTDLTHTARTTALNSSTTVAILLPRRIRNSSPTPRNVRARFTTLTAHPTTTTPRRTALLLLAVATLDTRGERERRTRKGILVCYHRSTGKLVLLCLRPSTLSVLFPLYRLSRSTLPAIFASLRVVVPLPALSSSCTVSLRRSDERRACMFKLLLLRRYGVSMQPNSS